MVRCQASAETARGGAKRHRSPKLDLPPLPEVLTPPAPPAAWPAADPASESDAVDAVTEIDNPLSPGEFVSVLDIDGLIDMYEQLDSADKRIYGAKLRIREALAGLTEGDAKTRRVKGKRRTAKITMPDDGWEQSILKEAWNSFPDYAEDVLAIAALRVKLREYKKLVNTSGDASFTTFRDMITNANRGPTGTPTVSIEE